MIFWIFGLAAAVLLVLYNFAVALPNLFDPEATKLILFLLVLCASILLAKWMSVLVATVAFRRQKSLSALVSLLVGVFVFAPAVAADLYFVLHVNLVAVLTTSAVVAIFFGLGFQSTLANLLEGLAMQLHRPFQLGDIVHYEGALGVVEDLSWRALRIRQDDGQALIVPNSALAKSSIRVAAKSDPIRLTAQFAAPADIEPRNILRAVETALAGLAGVHASSAPRCVITQFNNKELTVQYSVEIWTDAAVRDRYAVMSRVYERIWYVLARENIAFGFLISQTPYFFHLQPGKIESAARQVADIVLRDLSAEARSSLLAKSRLLMFGPDEAIPLRSATGPAALILVSGLVNVPLSSDSSPALQPMHGQVWSADVLESVTQHLREAIGPAAQHVVASVAPQTSDMYTLYQRLADQVPNEGARAAFLAWGPRLRVMTKRAGSTLNFATILAGGKEAAPECRVETAVLQIEGVDLQAVLRSHPEDAAAFAALVCRELEAAGYSRPLIEVEVDLRRRFAPAAGAGQAC